MTAVDLRQQAVDAMGAAWHSDEDDTAEGLLAAAEPFIRALVVQEVVAWARSNANDVGPVALALAPRDWEFAAAMIESQFAVLREVSGDA